MNDAELIGSADGVLTVRNGFPILFPSFDRVQLVEALRSGAYQLEEFREVVGHLKKIGAWRGSVFVDIGANVGTHTVYAMRESGLQSAVAVEPSVANARFLRMNLALNGVAEKVRVIEAAVCDREGEIELVTNPVNCGDYRLARRAEAVAETGFGSERTRTMTVDEVLDSYDARETALLWMDTQGNEGLILGASKRIASFAFPVYIEFWPDGLDRLGCYPLLRTFVRENAKRIVRFVGGEARAYAPEDVAAIYEELKVARRFCDLLLLRA